MSWIYREEHKYFWVVINLRKAKQRDSLLRHNHLSVKFIRNYVERNIFRNVLIVQICSKTYVISNVKNISTDNMQIADS